MSTSSRYFNETCEVFERSDCQSDILYVDPCSCSTYYQCSNMNLQKRDCALGTWFGVESGICQHDYELYNYPCHADENPWERCNVSDSRLEELRVMCNNMSLDTGGNEGKNAEQDGSPDAASNVGLIIGLIVAGAALAIVVMAFVLLLRRRRQNKKLIRGPSAQNPEYFRNNSDEYDVIDDTRRDPDSIPPSSVSTMARPNGTLPPIPTENVQYDNSAFSNPGFMDVTSKQTEGYETPFSLKTSDTSTKNSAMSSLNNKVKNVSIDVNGNSDKVL